MLFLEGVITQEYGKVKFKRVKATSHSVMEALVNTISQRIAQYLEKAGLIQCDMAAEATGKWLAEDTSRRDRLVLVTKVHEPMSDDVNDRGLSARHIQLACDASLRRLGVDHIDLYQMHHIDRLAPIEEIW